MADINYSGGGIIGCSATVTTVAIPVTDKPVSFRNKDGARVFLKVNAATSAITTAAAADQYFLDPDESLTVPPNTTSVALITAAGAATVQMMIG